MVITEQMQHVAQGGIMGWFSKSQPESKSNERSDLEERDRLLNADTDYNTLVKAIEKLKKLNPKWEISPGQNRGEVLHNFSLSCETVNGFSVFIFGNETQSDSDRYFTYFSIYIVIYEGRSLWKKDVYGKDFYSKILSDPNVVTIYNDSFTISFSHYTKYDNLMNYYCNPQSSVSNIQYIQFKRWDYLHSYAKEVCAPYYKEKNSEEEAAARLRTEQAKKRFWDM